MPKTLWGENGEIPYVSYKHEIGSITKTFTGLLVARAVLEKKFSLDDSIVKYITELDKNKYWPTIRMLVTHSSGIPGDDHGDWKDEDIEATNLYGDITRSALLEQISKLSLENKVYPAEYSNSGAALVGIILERVYNKSYKDLVCELTAHLKLNETSIFDYDDSLLKGIGAKGNLCNNWIWKEDCALACAGALLSTPENLLSYGKHILENKYDYIDIATQKHGTFEEESRLDIGCFWFHFRNFDVYFHNGNTGCFNCSIAVDRKNQAVMVVLSNKKLEDKGLFVISDIIKART